MKKFNSSVIARRCKSTKQSIFVAAVLFISLQSANIFAFTIDEPLENPVPEERAESLFREIRCMVCAGETIADSQAEVARDMRREIRKKIAAGTADEDIKAEFAGRYGDVVLMKPPLKSGTMPLWLGPWFVLVCGAGAVYFYFRGARKRG